MNRTFTHDNRSGDKIQSYSPPLDYHQASQRGLVRWYVPGEEIVGNMVQQNLVMTKYSINSDFLLQIMH